MKLEHHHFKSIDSTNSWAKRNSDALARDCLTVVTAEGQTAGHGRFNRQWLSPLGQNIYSSFCFFLPVGRQDIVNVAQVLSLSLAKTLRGLHYNVWLKWPNDLLIDNRKLGGVLCEAVPSQNEVCVIAGAGLNVNMGQEVVQQISQPATSLMLERGHHQPLELIMGRIVAGVAADIGLFIERGFAPFLDEYRKYLVHPRGDSLRIQNGAQTLQGSFIDIDEAGHLRLQTEDGVKIIVAGEITDADVIR